MMTDESTYSFVVPEGDKKRLDQTLCLQFPEYSRSYFQHLIEEGAVRVNGSLKKKRELVCTGDLIELTFLITPELELLPEPIPLDILYEDEEIIAINKPAGLVVHPAPGHWTGTFVNALLYHCKQVRELDSLRPGVVHRLDKDTSGVLLAAKTRKAHAALTTLFAERKIQKEYLAICVGKPKEGLIDAPIGRHPVKRQEMRIDWEKGRPAQSILSLQGTDKDLSFVQIQLLTGRTHQIRVHLKHLNTPILGDPVYGKKGESMAPRQMLHAHTLSFAHPFTNKPLSLIAPLPADMESRWMKK